LRRARGARGVPRGARAGGRRRRAGRGVGARRASRRRRGRAGGGAARARAVGAGADALEDQVVALALDPVVLAALAERSGSARLLFHALAARVSELESAD